MFKTQYEFEAKYPQSISFAANDILLGLRKENEHWLLAYHSDGRLGAVPFNYLQEKSLNNGESLKLVEGAIRDLRKKELFEQETLLQYLLSLKNFFSEEKGDLPLPALPVRKEEKLNATQVKSKAISNGLLTPVAIDKQNRQLEKSSSAEIERDNVPVGLSFLLADKLRSTTKASYGKCLKGLTEILRTLSIACPQFTPVSGTLEGELSDPSMTVRRSIYARTADWLALRHNITRLEERAKDFMENNWPLSENDCTLIAELDAFAELLCDASVDMVKTCICDDRLPRTLSYLYQMEKRPVIRRFYLLLVIATCHIQPAVIPDYLDSVLPLEVMRELSDICPKEIDFVLNLRVLAVLMGTSSWIPVKLQDQLSVEFFQHVFSAISGCLEPTTVQVADLMSFSGDSTPIKNITPPSTAFACLDLDAKRNLAAPYQSSAKHEPSVFLLDAFLRFILSANRHFCVQPLSNEMTPIMECLVGKYDASRDLLEELLRMFNRGGDLLSLNGVHFVRKLRGQLSESLSRVSLYKCAENMTDLISAEGSGCSSRRSSILLTDEDRTDEGHQTSPLKTRHECGCTNATMHVVPDTPKNAARKLLADVFTDQRTASLIYCNDVDVLVDVIIRQLCDLPSNSSALPEYIFIMDKIVQTSEYLTRNGGYRLGELIEALRGVEYHANQSTDCSFTTSRSVRLATSLLGILAAKGKYTDT